MGNAFQHLSVQIQHEYGTAYMLAFKLAIMFFYWELCGLSVLRVSFNSYC